MGGLKSIQSVFAHFFLFFALSSAFASFYFSSVYTIIWEHVVLVTYKPTYTLFYFTFTTSLLLSAVPSCITYLLYTPLDGTKQNNTMIK